MKPFKRNREFIINIKINLINIIYLWFKFKDQKYIKKKIKNMFNKKLFYIIYQQNKYELYILT